MRNEHSHHTSARRRFLQVLGVGAGIGTAVTLSASADDHHDDDGDGDHDDDYDDDYDDRDDAVPPDEGLETLESDAPFEETLERAETEIEERDLVILETVDHAENAAEVGEDLPPTTLFLFANPEVGTPLIRAERTMGLDLPLKLLVWEDDETVYLTYDDPRFLGERHGVVERGEDNEAVDSVALAVSDLVESIAESVDEED